MAPDQDKGIGRKAPTAPLDVPLLYRAGALTDIARDGHVPIVVIWHRVPAPQYRGAGR